MWIGFLPFALLLLIAAVFFSVRAVRTHRKVNEKKDELENELIKIRAKSDKKKTDPSEKSKSNQT
jgi:hypothetical protein